MSKPRANKKVGAPKFTQRIRKEGCNLRVPVMIYQRDKAGRLAYREIPGTAILLTIEAPEQLAGAIDRIRKAVGSLLP